MERKRNNVHKDPRLKVSAIITSFNEPRTICKALKSMINQTYPVDEIFVVAPDEDTLNSAKQCTSRIKNVRLLKDPGKGKPTALNLAIAKTKGNVVVLTDGDVYISSSAVAEIVKELDSSVGAVSGRVVSVNNRNNLLGFWAYCSTESLHNSRLKNLDLCSGYLYAIQKDLFSSIPKNTLADDAYISLMIKRSGKEMRYAPRAEVYVRYPENLKDWIKQKKRTAGKFYQLSKEFRIHKEKEFLKEIRSGLHSLRLIVKLRHVSYLLLFLVMRLYIWMRIFFDYRLWNRKFERTWLRPASTKKPF